MIYFFDVLQFSGGLGDESQVDEDFVDEVSFDELGRLTVALFQSFPRQLVVVLEKVVEAAQRRG